MNTPQQKKARERLEQIRSVLPTRLGESVGRIYRTTRLAQIEGILDLLEWLFFRINSLGNASYLDSEEEVERMDGYLRSHDASRLSFGQHVEFLTIMRKNEARGPLAKVLDSVGREPLPLDVRYLDETVKMVEEAVHKYDIPSDKLNKYVKEKARPKNQIGKKSGPTTLSKFGGVVAKTRNQKNHKASKESQDTEKPWWRSDNQFEEVMADALLEAIESLLIWDPMAELITRYEQVTALEDGVKQLNGTYLTPILRDERSEAILPLGPAHMVSDFPTIKESTYWADGLDSSTHDKLISQPKGICPKVDFPTPKVANEEIHQRYTKAFYERFLNDGIIDPQQRSELDELAQKYKLDKKSQDKLETSVVERVESLAAQCRALEVKAIDYKELQRRARDSNDTDAGDTSYVYLRSKMEAFVEEFGLKDANMDKLLNAASQLRQMRRRYLHEKEFQRSAFLARTEIELQTGLNPDTLNALLGDLVQEGIIRAVGGELGKERGYFKLVDVANVKLFEEVISRYEESGLSPSDEMLTLLRVCASALDFGAIESPHLGRVNALLPDDQSSEAKLSLEIWTSQEPIKVRGNTLKELCTEFWNSLPDTSAALEHVPFPKTRKRYLVNTQEEHRGQRRNRFREPHQVGDVYFETNYSDEEFVSLLRDFAEEIGVGPPAPRNISR